MAHSPGLVTLRYCVMNTLNELGDYSMTWYNKYLQLAIDAFRTLNMKHIQSVKIVYLPVDADMKYVTLPTDYLDYVKVAIPQNGQVWTLTKNDSLLLPRDMECGEPVLNTSRGEGVTLDSTSWGGYYFTDHFHNGRWVNDLYAIGGGFNTAYFRVDEERGVIQLNGTIPNSEIILEYISSGIDLCGDTFVPVKALDTIKAYIHWKRLEYDPRVALSDKDRKERLYYAEARKLDANESVPTLSEYLDTMYATTKQTPHR